jgi:hypothetical protein
MTNHSLRMRGCLQVVGLVEWEVTPEAARKRETMAEIFMMIIGRT